MGTYEADDTRSARLALDTALEQVREGAYDDVPELSMRTVKSLRKKYHALRDRDAALEAAVRAVILPDPLVEAVAKLVHVHESGAAHAAVFEAVTSVSTAYDEAYGNAAQD